MNTEFKIERENKLYSLKTANGEVKISTENGYPESISYVDDNSSNKSFHLTLTREVYVTLFALREFEKQYNITHG